MNAELLDESGALALFAGETADDVLFNKPDESDRMRTARNSLFLRLRGADGTDEWRLLLTSGSGWREADGMSEWCQSQVHDLQKDFFVCEARFSSDGRHLWLVCDPSCTFWWDVVCSYDASTNTFRALVDGDSADEQPDGTIRVKGKKSYPDDGLGAAWRDVWVNSDGKIVREGEFTLRGCDL